MIWLLFLAIRLKIRLSASKITPVFEMENAMIALLVTYGASRGLVNGKIDHRTWARSLNADGLQSPMWLYAYESVRQGVKPAGNAEFVALHEFFAPIYAKNVSFLSIEEGFTSVSTLLRGRRGENVKMKRLRADFVDDFDFELDEFDEDDEDVYDVEFEDY